MLLFVVRTDTPNLCAERGGVLFVRGINHADIIGFCPALRGEHACAAASQGNFSGMQKFSCPAFTNGGEKRYHVLHGENENRHQPFAL
jgi:hypothetical protein